MRCNKTLFDVKKFRSRQISLSLSLSLLSFSSSLTLYPRRCSIIKSLVAAGPELLFYKLYILVSHMPNRKKGINDKLETMLVNLLQL